MSELLTDKKSAFAKRINSTASYVTKLIKMGMPVTSSGDIPVTDALGWIRENLKAKAGRPDGRLNGISEDTPASEELLAARIRLVTAQAARAEHELDVSQEKYVDIEIARRVVRAGARNMRDAILNVPSRYGQVVAAQFQIPAGEFIGVLDATLRDALTSISDELQFNAGSFLEEQRLFDLWKKERQANDK